jgi:hypothetical protein
VGYVEERRLRYRAREVDGKLEEVPVWTYDVWDVRGIVPIFRIDEILEYGKERKDVTAEFSGVEDGSYPYVDREGKPIMPYVLAHGMVGSTLWDPTEGIELVEGALQLAMGWSLWWDGYQNAANPQRVAIDVKFGGSRTKTVGGGANVETIPVSPKSVLQGVSTGPPGSGRIDSFPPGMDPAVGVAALRSYEERVAIFAGISPADIQASSNPSSGIAISISRAGKREKQLAMEPALRMADQLILATGARLANVGLPGLDLPESPRSWLIEYHQIGESSQERKVRVETIALEQGAGALNKVGALRRLNPEIETDEEALELLAQMAEQDAQVGADGGDTASPAIQQAAASAFAMLEAAVRDGTPLTAAQAGALLETLADISGMAEPDAGDGNQ